ncbi:hypothetical protein D5H75_02855 [Bailinhaonella thermotolerans]|uniref:Uncharacterized protein n=1 Tax=Bailinhaonella thermotolerans TaxID=1070861 RepID=A0A3A4BA09_9ACTN|nr:hypothetical protein D5H75_02855 [Bailinhaonella thermotolerans]
MPLFSLFRGRFAALHGVDPRRLLVVRTVDFTGGPAAFGAVVGSRASARSWCRGVSQPPTPYPVISSPGSGPTNPSATRSAWIRTPGLGRLRAYAEGRTRFGAGSGPRSWGSAEHSVRLSRPSWRGLG